MEVRVAHRSEVSAVEVRSFYLPAREIVLCEVDGEVYALDGICTHEDLSLDGGELEDGIIECPWHGARYHARDGRVRGLPATRALRTYRVRIDGAGEVFVDFPS